MSTSFLVVLVHIIYIVHAIWELGPASLPRPCKFMAAGLYNGSIFTIGGHNGTNPLNQLIELDIESGTFIDHGHNALIWNTGQFWTQKADDVYMLPNTGTTTNSLTVFNMATKELTPNWQGVALPFEYRSGCLSTSDDALFIAGGSITTLLYGTPSNIADTPTQALNLTTYSWTTAAMLNTPRSNIGCVVHSNYLWAIAGASGSNAQNVVERIPITDIEHQSWSYTNPLSVKVIRPGAAKVGDLIYVIGGLLSAYSKSDAMHIIDPQSGTVTVSPDTLSYQIDSSAVVTYDGTILSFGGETSGSSREVKDSWMYYHTPSQAPSNPSSLSPTDNPVIEPSRSPFVLPTGDPTIGPSHSPFVLPTGDPTTGPSHSPSQNPAIYDYPTGQPTTGPNTIATHNIQTTTTRRQPRTPSKTSNNDSNNTLYIVLSLVVILMLLVCILVVARILIRMRSGGIVRDEMIVMKENTMDGVTRMDYTVEGPSAVRDVQLVNALPNPQDHKDGVVLGYTHEGPQDNDYYENATKQTDDGDNVNICDDEFVIHGDDEMNDTNK
eukprot:107628_1